MPSKDTTGERLGATFYMGLVVSWAISAVLSLFFVIWSANNTIIVSVIAANILSLVAALEVASRQKKRLAFVVSYAPTLLLVGGLFVLGIWAGGFPTWTWW